MVSVVLTSCGRLDLLKRTVESFMAFNTYPITEYIMVDDSANKAVHDEIRRLYPDWTLVLEDRHLGQSACIDAAYDRVRTKYIFHMEDDWEFFKGGFIEPSIKILEHDPGILQVWVLWGNKHTIEPPVFKADDVEYRLLGSMGMWHGFSWNPGLRRKSDWLRIAPFASFVPTKGHWLLTEGRIGQKYHELGYRVAILNDEYSRHIGAGRHVD